LPEHSWSAAEKIFARIESLGFDHVWTYDHLSWETLRDEPWYGALPLLTAVAASTSRIRLGTLVSSPNYRHPVPFAKELMTLDDISGGRFTLGFGSGTINHDAWALGTLPWSPRERTERFEEFVALLDTLLTTPSTRHRGTYYSARDVRNIPGCVQQPRIPFAIAATGPRAMRLAASYADCWVTLGDPGAGPADHFAALPRIVARFEAACEQVGRDPATVDRLILTGCTGPNSFESIPQFTDAVGRYGELGFTDVVVHYPRAGEPYAGDPSVLDEIAALVD
jgi:alkanesulfonate monooxygenase SsuD/methylene tetrahydromethanopterin reductase-like flavin-dependent oxidoreductase (luciferase family)